MQQFAWGADQNNRDRQIAYRQIMQSLQVGPTLVTGVPGTTDRGTTNRERERRFRCNFYTVGKISFPRSRPERSFPERGTLHRSRSAVTRGPT
jgi:hypothetical protein